MVEKKEKTKEAQILDRGIYEFMIFGRAGMLLYRADYSKSSALVLEDRMKLISGLIWSLRSFAKICMPEDKRAIQEFKSFKTDYYKMHYFEVPTGLKFVILTKKTNVELTPFLELLYASIYIPYVSRNVFYKIGTEIKCLLFDQELTKFMLDAPQL